MANTFVVRLVRHENVNGQLRLASSKLSADGAVEAIRQILHGEQWAMIEPGDTLTVTNEGDEDRVLAVLKDLHRGAIDPQEARQRLQKMGV